MKREMMRGRIIKKYPIEFSKRMVADALDMGYLILEDPRQDKYYVGANPDDIVAYCVANGISQLPLNALGFQVVGS